MEVDPDKRLEILHDHFKDSFSLQRDREKQRDRLFIWVIVLFGLLALEIGYPAEFGGSLESLSLAGGQINLSKLPLAALLSATWVVTLALSLRYCQTALAIDRQYPYIHHLEDAISPLVGGGKVYRREGKVYLDKYPLLLNVAWWAYVVFFPLIAMVAAISLILWEWFELDERLAHKVFDSLVALTLCACLFLYRVEPYVRARLMGRSSRRQSSD